MKWSSICLCLTLVVSAAPGLAQEAVPFGGFTGLILGNPTGDAVEVSARSYLALYALAEYGGLTQVGVTCEVEGPQGRVAGSGKFKVNISLMRNNGSQEDVARMKMRVRAGAGEADKLRTINVQPGDYLIFEFVPKKRLELGPGEQAFLIGYAGSPDAL